MGRDRIRDVQEREYPLRAWGIFLNAASYGLLPRRAVIAANEITARRGEARGFQDRELGQILSRCRSAAAQLVGADEEEIVLAPNTSYGVNLAAHCAAATGPGVVLLSEGEFPANVFPWLALERAGFRVERVPTDSEGCPDEGRLMERIGTGDVRVLALSATQFSTGYTADLAAFGMACRERETLFAVDAIQALGVIPMDVRELGIDILATGGQKWLCAPWGSGFAYVSRELHDRFDPPSPSWLAFGSSLEYTGLLDYRYEFLPDGRKFELATLGIQDCAALAASIELLLEVKVSEVRRHVLALHAPILDWAEGADGVEVVTPLDPPKRAGIIALRIPDPIDVGRALQAEGVVCVVREGLLRLSPHFYNTLEEIEQVVEVLEGLVSG